MTHWYKNETVICNYNEIDYKVNELFEKYKTNVALIPKIYDHDEPVYLDVWLNFDTGIHLITAHLKQEEVNY